MRIDLITLFPEMCEAVMGESIVGRARGAGFLEVFCHQLRDYAFNKHNRVDDSPYGGGMGMLLQAEPIALCFEDVCRQAGTRPHFIYMSPQGKVLTQERIKELAQYDNICILCGHYEGVDERVLDEYADEQISIGDYVLTGRRAARACPGGRGLPPCPRRAGRRGMLRGGEPLQRPARIPALYPPRALARQGNAGNPSFGPPWQH